MPNQNLEQIARDNIDKQLIACGWAIQHKRKINLHASIGVAVIGEYQTDAGPVDYLLFVDGKPCGVIEAKKEDEGFHLNVHEDQTEGYAYYHKFPLCDEDTYQRPMPVAIHTVHS